MKKVYLDREQVAQLEFALMYCPMAPATDKKMKKISDFLDYLEKNDLEAIITIKEK